MLRSLLLVILFTGITLCQTFNARVTGTVTDATGAVVPGFSPTGSFSFGAGMTQMDPLAATNATQGMGLASFLLGTGTSYQFEHGEPLTAYHHYVGAYVQDDWKVTPRLTLNFGLRWETETGNDACDPRYLSPDPVEAARAFQFGKQLAIGFAAWLRKQDANLRVEPGALGTRDGLSQYPYIRESRRMAALAAVREQDLAEPWQSGARARSYQDTAGIGYYPIDIHGCGSNVRLPRSKPYQIPFGALISREIPNLLAAAKNLGVTHITNGAYRVHPTEWAVGEAAGTLAARAVRLKRDPAVLGRDHAEVRGLQWQLLQAGHPLVWFDDVAPEDAAFAEIQFAAVTGRMPPAADSLHFRPHDPVSGAEAAAAFHSLDAWSQRPALEWSDLGILDRKGPVSRAEFARWLRSKTP